ncbi:hypothetical protein [Pseudoxanthomonas indica]|uniref:Uncharacterized protein n=1 Tax=Pseudoxanthomonas indica TaxID=428993 RepID=A0A1T5LHL7_9GAMM|nr:hypothetical protein [Pseudoxanthomonas indica]GGD35090.1 hypothetical protein GCM10007235_03780 [Pseudoxanthomonas indica]SKC75245.1 hypothetical protein SAMN06296058_2504 [Pseudoxanthomonas indica]
MDWAPFADGPRVAARAAQADPGIAAAAAAAAAGARANGSQPLVPGGYFTIVGDVVDLASANEPMTVTARVGTRVFPAVVQGHTYSVSVSGGPSTAMVKVEVESTRVHYESVLGTFGRLQALAGPDARLVQAENAWVKVSSYTTALSLMSEFQLGGRQAANDTDIQRGMRATPTEDLEAAAYLLIRGITDPTPAYFPNGYEMVKNQVEYSLALREDSDLLYATYGFLSKRPPTAPVASLSELPEQLVMSDGVSALDLPLGGKRTVFLLQKEAGNQVSFLESYPMAHTQYRASIASDGTVVLEPDVPPVHRAFSRDHDATVERRRTRYELRRLYQGDPYSHWAIKMFWTEQVVSSPDLPVVTGSTEYVMAGIDVQRWSQPQGWVNPSNQLMVMPWLCIDSESNLNRCESTRHSFAANGNGSTLGYGMKFADNLAMAGESAPGPDFSWSIDSAARTLQITAGAISTTFWRVDGQDHGAGTLLYLAREQGSGQVQVSLDFVIPQPDPAQWLSSGEGQWRRSDYSPSSIRFYYYYWPGQFDMTRTAGVATYYRRPPASRVDVPPLDYLTYTQQGAVVDHRVNRITTPTTCAIYYPATCQTLLVYFRPLLRVGNRYYGLQEEYEHLAGGSVATTLTRTSSRAVFQDCLAGACNGVTGLTDVAAAPSHASAGRAWMIDRAPVQRRARYKGIARADL